MFHLTETLNEHLTRVTQSFQNKERHNNWKDQIFKDWGRMLTVTTKGNCISFNGEKATVSFTLSNYNNRSKEEENTYTNEIINLIEANLAGIHKDIIQYIFEHGTHKNGFLNAAEDALVSDYLGLKKSFLATSSDQPRKLNFIRNKDGSVTYVEQFQVRVKAQINSSGIGVNLDTKDISLMGVTSSTIKRNSNGQIEHTINYNKVYLFDSMLDNQNKIQIFDNSFDKNDEHTGIITHYYNAIDEINERINTSIASLVKENQIKFDELKSLKDKFNLDDFAICFNKIYDTARIAEKSWTPSHPDWLTLTSAIKKMQKIINAQIPSEQEQINNFENKTSSDSFFNIIKPSNKYPYQEQASEYINSRKYKELEKIYNKNILAAQYYRLKKITDDNDTPLKVAGKEVLYYTNLALQDKMVKPDELPVLAKFIKHTANAIEHPERPTNITRLCDDIKDGLSGKYRRWGKLIGGAMLGVLGLIVIAASVSLFLATFGLSSPLSGLGFALSASLLLNAITICSASLLAVSGLTAGAASIGFLSLGYQQNIATSGEEVLKLTKSYKS